MGWPTLSPLQCGSFSCGRCRPRPGGRTRACRRLHGEQDFGRREVEDFAGSAPRRAALRCTARTARHCVGLYAATPHTVLDCMLQRRTLCCIVCCNAAHCAVHTVGRAFSAYGSPCQKGVLTPQLGQEAADRQWEALMEQVRPFVRPPLIRSTASASRAARRVAHAPPRPCRSECGHYALRCGVRRVAAGALARALRRRHPRRR